VFVEISWFFVGDAGWLTKEKRGGYELVEAKT
jgi:hypothetical protein